MIDPTTARAPTPRQAPSPQAAAETVQAFEDVLREGRKSRASVAEVAPESAPDMREAMLVQGVAGMDITQRVAAELRGATDLASRASQELKTSGESTAGSAQASSDGSEPRLERTLSTAAEGGKPRAASGPSTDSLRPDAQPLSGALTTDARGSGGTRQGAGPSESATHAAGATTNRGGVAGRTSPVAQGDSAPAAANTRSVQASTSGADKVGTASRTDALAVTGAPGRGRNDALLRTLGAAPKARAQAPEAAITSQAMRGIGAAIEKGGGTVTLRLRPEGLGALTVQVSLRGERVQAAFEVTNESARQLLEHSVPQLRSALEARGLEVERVEIALRDNAREGAVSGERSAVTHAERAERDGARDAESSREREGRAEDRSGFGGSDLAGQGESRHGRESSAGDSSGAAPEAPGHEWAEPELQMAPMVLAYVRDGSGARLSLDALA